LFTENCRISNKNRRKTKKNAIFVDEGESSNIEKIDHNTELQDANDLLSNSGMDGTAYFDDKTDNKRTKLLDPKKDSSSNNKNEDIDLVTDLGWVKDKQEAESLFEYSNISNMMMYDPTASVEENPFFNGAAISGGNLSQQHSGLKQDKKKYNSSGRKGKKNNTSNSGAINNKVKMRFKSGQSSSK